MSTLLAQELDRAEAYARDPYRAGTGHSRTADCVANTPEARARLALRADVERALADQVVADNPGLQGTTIAVSALSAARAPVIAQIASPLATGPKPQVPGVIDPGSVLDSTEKAPTWPVADGSDVLDATVHMAASALNLSYQITDWAALAVAYDEAIESAALARLEAALLADLVAAGEVAADLAAALAAADPAPTHVIAATGTLVAAAPLLAQLSAAGFGLTLIATPNLTTETLVISRPGVVFSATSPTIRRTNEPAILGVAVGAYVYGLAAPRLPSAVQVIGVG